MARMEHNSWINKYWSVKMLECVHLHGYTYPCLLMCRASRTLLLTAALCSVNLFKTECSACLFNVYIHAYYHSVCMHGTPYTAPFLSSSGMRVSRLCDCSVAPCRGVSCGSGALLVGVAEDFSYCWLWETIGLENFSSWWISLSFFNEWHTIDVGCKHSWLLSTYFLLSTQFWASFTTLC